MTLQTFPIARANVGFAKYNDLTLLDRGLAIKQGMSSTSYFPAPPTTMEDLQSTLDQYSNSIGFASSRDSNAVMMKNQNKRNLVDILIGLGNYVTSTAAGDVDMLNSSNFDIRKVNQATPPLQQPVNIQAADGINSGEVIISVEPPAYVKMYIHQYKTDEGEWQGTNCTKSKCTIKGLTKGVNYTFRVMAVGTKGQQTCSNTVSRIAQ